MADYDFDFLAINETRVDESTDAGMVDINNTSFVRLDSNIDLGGGVEMYTK